MNLQSSSLHANFLKLNLFFKLSYLVLYLFLRLWGLYVLFVINRKFNSGTLDKSLLFYSFLQLFLLSILATYPLAPSLC